MQTELQEQPWKIGLKKKNLSLTLVMLLFLKTFSQLLFCY
jgi:hypothetical protein